MKQIIFCIILLLNIGNAIADSFNLKFIADFIPTNINTTLTTTDVLTNGTQIQYNKLLGLQGTSSSSGFCNNQKNLQAITQNQATCSTSTDPNMIKITFPMLLAYNINSNVQIDLVGITLTDPIVGDPLLNITVGGSVLTSSMGYIDGLSYLHPVVNGSISSSSYAGVEPDKNANISFEIPFKGNSFKNERKSVVKLLILIKPI
jgi:hypothetical protein